MRRGLPQALDQPIQSRGIAFDREGLSARAQSNVQAVFRYVDANSDDIHGDPSLPNRASRIAAQATVRVRWNGGRGAELTYGLQRPRGHRTPARHRDTQLMRVAAMRVTRGPNIPRIRPLTRPLAALASTLSRKGRGEGSKSGTPTSISSPARCLHRQSHGERSPPAGRHCAGRPAPGSP